MASSNCDTLHIFTWEEDEEELKVVLNDSRARSLLSWETNDQFLRRLAQR